jgi:anaerobic magnesium-protoporphyrin IX monomethyl ester cyclase
MRMRALFIFKNENFMAPLGICSLSAVAKKSGHQVYLCEMNSEDPLKRIVELKPDLVAYSSSSGEAKHYLKLNQFIKDRFPGLFTIMGGPHPTFFPDVIKDSTLDAICIGEGEGAFVELLEALQNKKDIGSIPNIMTKESRQINIRCLLEDLDSLPHPDYDLFFGINSFGSYPLKSFMNSRGCPYHCTYCLNHAWNKLHAGKGRIVRRHSVGYVIEGIERVREKWPLSSIKFYDDIFSYQADAWLEEFSRAYKERIGLPFFALIRADILNEEIARLLKAAGCRTLSMSIEAGNQEIRNRLLKRSMTDEQLIKAHEICRKYGIFTFTNCILGLPETTIKNDLESIDLAIRCKVDWAEFAVFYPYPKTELGQYCIDKGYYHPDYERMHTSCMSVSPLSCFTDKEKALQRNLCTLGAVAVVFPVLRKVVYGCMIKLKHNRFYTFLYYLTKMYVFRRKIYVTKTTFSNSVRIFLRSLRQELYRHGDSDKVKCEG